MATARPPVGRVVRAPRTAELVAARIRTRIVHGDLAAGDSLPSESELTAQFGVSRPTLREAFRILEAESLIQVTRGAHGGARVRIPDMTTAARYVGLLLQMNRTTLVDVYEARCVLEPPCAGFLAARRDDAAVRELRDAVDQLRDAVAGDPGDAARWASLALRFHEIVVRSSGNKSLALQGGMLHEIAARHMSAVVARRGPHDPVVRRRFGLMVRSCRRLADLVEAGDVVGAERHWRSHMRAVATSLLDDVRPTTVVELLTADGEVPSGRWGWGAAPGGAPAVED